MKPNVATHASGQRVHLDGGGLTPADYLAVARRRARVSLAPAARTRMQASRDVIEAAIREGRPVYGVTTGFGELARVSISPAELDELQVNLIRSHAVGVGPALADAHVRGMLLLRANSLAAGYSGVRPRLVEMLIELLNRDVVPVVPSQGSVGASGDLAPLAHLAQVLIGEGEAKVGGRRLRGGEALRRVGLEPLRLAPKEGIALINGTQLMTAIGLSALADARAVAAAAEVAAAMSVEALKGSHTPFDVRFSRVRPHPGHARVARRIARMLRGSEIRRSHRHCGRVQDAYSLRCIPQVMGASQDAIEHVERVLTIEMNAVTDNPLVFPEVQADTNGRPSRLRPGIIAGGNFHGQPVSLALDYLAIAVAELGSISERRSYRLLDSAHSGLTPFLTANPGTRSGLMVVQYTAAALVSENKVMCHPATVDSIPTCAGTEDHVSMGPIAARKAAAVVANVARVIAVELTCAAQAVEEHRPLRAGVGVEEAIAKVRALVPPLREDRPMGEALETLAEAVLEGTFGGN